MSRSNTNPVAYPARSQGPTIRQRFAEVRSVFITELQRRVVQRLRARNVDPDAERSRESVHYIRRSVWLQMGVSLHRTTVRLIHVSRMSPLFSLAESMDALIIAITDSLTDEFIDGHIDAAWIDLGFNQS